LRADVLTSARNAGMRYVRLRVFNTPRDEKTGNYLNPAYQGPDRTLDVAKQVKTYLDDHPDTKADMTGIRQPLTDLRDRCGAPPSP